MMGKKRAAMTEFSLSRPALYRFAANAYRIKLIAALNLPNSRPHFMKRHEQRT
jgi:hypothetical protein